jgi:RNA polymerase sigma-70 factor (ECF subfamily)
VTAVAAAPRVLEDAHLVQRHLEGDPQAFAALVDRYQTPVLTFVNGIVRDRERSEDIVLDVFIRIYRHLRWFDRRREFQTWIYAIASHLAEAALPGRLHPRS